MGRSAKWTKWYTGPFLVVQQLGPVTFLIQKNVRCKAQVVHVDKLKKCEGPTPRAWLGPGAEGVGASETAVVEAENRNGLGTEGSQDEVREESSDRRSQGRPTGPTREQPRAAPPPIVTASERPKRNAPKPARYLLRGEARASSAVGWGRVATIRPQ